MYLLDYRWKVLSRVVLLLISIFIYIYIYIFFFFACPSITDCQNLFGVIYRCPKEMKETLLMFRLVGDDINKPEWLQKLTTALANTACMADSVRNLWNAATVENKNHFYVWQPLKFFVILSGPRNSFGESSAMFGCRLIISGNVRGYVNWKIPLIRVSLAAWCPMRIRGYDLPFNRQMPLSYRHLNLVDRANSVLSALVN